MGFFVMAHAASVITEILAGFQFLVDDFVDDLID